MRTTAVVSAIGGMLALIGAAIAAVPLLDPPSAGPTLVQGLRAGACPMAVALDPGYGLTRIAQPPNCTEAQHFAALRLTSFVAER